jgi:hypothetical protein
MFGPLHPRRSGSAGLSATDLDTSLPGFGPFGTAGHHCFDPTHPSFRRIAALTAVRQEFPVLRHGRQYFRPLDVAGALTKPRGGDVLGWSRILDAEEALVVANTHGTQAATEARVLIDATLHPADGTLTVVANSAQAADPAGFAGGHPVGSTVPVEKDGDGSTFVTVRSLGPSEVLVLTNVPVPVPGTIATTP